MEDGVPDTARRIKPFENALQAASKLLERIRPEREHAGNVTAEELDGLRVSLGKLRNCNSLDASWLHDRTKNFGALLETVTQLSRLLPPFQLRLLRERDRLASEQLRLTSKQAWAAGNQRTL